MRLEDLTDEELKVFVEGQSLNFLRNIYANVNVLRDKLKGFRPNKATKQILVTNSLQILKRERNGKLASILMNQYDDYVKELHKLIDEMMENGYSEDFAFAIKVRDLFNSDFRKIFYKLEEISEEDQSKYDSLMNIADLVEVKAKETVNKSINPELSDKVESLENKLNKVEKDINELQKIDNEQNDCIDKISNLIKATKKELEVAFSSKVDKKELDRRINDVLNILKNELNSVSKSNDFIEIKKEIADLRNIINNLPVVPKSEIYDYESIISNDFSSMEDCEYLRDDIGDVIEDIVDGDAFDIMKEFLVETLYGNKPIITTSKNLSIVTDIYASILTGGNYFVINVTEGYNYNKIIKTIEEITSKKDNTVIAISGLINSYDHRALLTYLSGHPFTHKFIFDIHYSAEIKFMPHEMLNDFYFFLGNINNNKIEYKYLHVFEPRKTLTNNLYDKTLTQLDVELDSNALYNIKFYGLLAYSIIPFVSINKSVETSDLINQILDFNTRKKCEAVLSD